MAAAGTNEYKSDKRRSSRTLVREGMFISDFVKTKYEGIYNEAATLYNEINRLNPKKPDLRRSKEYRQWKNDCATSRNMPSIIIPREKKRKLVHIPHRNIPISTSTNNTATESTKDKRISGMTMQLNIPLMSNPIPVESGQPSEGIPTESAQLQDEIPTESIQPPDEIQTESVMDEGTKPLTPR